MVMHRILAGAAATWVAGYLALYLFLIRRSDATVAVWYVVVLAAVVALLVAVVVGGTARAGLAVAAAVLVPATVLALLTIGLLLVPGLLLTLVALGFSLRTPRSDLTPAG